VKYGQSKDMKDYDQGKLGGGGVEMRLLGEIRAEQGHERQSREHDPPQSESCTAGSIKQGVGWSRDLVAASVIRFDQCQLLRHLPPLKGIQGGGVSRQAGGQPPAHGLHLLRSQPSVPQPQRRKHLATVKTKVKFSLERHSTHTLGVSRFHIQYTRL